MLSVWVPTEVRREHLILLQPFVRYLLFMLGSELRSSDRVVSSLNGWTISSLLICFLEEVLLCGPGWSHAASAAQVLGLEVYNSIPGCFTLLKCFL